MWLDSEAELIEFSHGERMQFSSGLSGTGFTKDSHQARRS